MEEQKTAGVHIDAAKKVRVTPQRLVFLRLLKDGPKTWKDLKAAYYGPERNKSKSHTSFDNQCRKLQAKGIIKHEDGHYELDELGTAMLSLVDDSQMESAKSLAQKQFEAGKEAV